MIPRADNNRLITPSGIEHGEVFDKDRDFNRNEIDPPLAPDPVILPEDTPEDEEESS